MNTKRGFAPLLILIVVVMVAIGGGAYVYTKNRPNSQQTSSKLNNWQTYENSKLGIKFQYPQNWFVREEITAYNNRIYIENKKYTNQEAAKLSLPLPKDYLMMWIDYRKPSEKTFSYEQQIAMLDSRTDRSRVKNIIQNKNATVNTYEFAYNPESEKSGVGPYLVAVWKDNQWIYNAETMDSDYKENNIIEVNTLKQSLSTFEFTSSSTDVNSGAININTNAGKTVAGWKTYTNQKYGFSFQYPSDWSIISQDDKSVRLMNPIHKKQYDACPEGKKYFCTFIDFSANACVGNEDGACSYPDRLGEYMESMGRTKDNPNTPYRYKELTIGGEKGFEWLEHTSNEGGYVFNVTHNGRVYGMGVQGDYTWETAPKITKDIVSTFRFVSSATTQVDTLPTKVGECAITTITALRPRVTTSEFGSIIDYKNGGRQVTQQAIPGVDHSQVGDKVKLCLLALPKDCPAGDTRGKLYGATNQRTGESWQAIDSNHACGGA